MVRCKECGDEHPSLLIQMDEKQFNNPTIVLKNNSEQCPKCGKRSTYNKPDYFFKK